VLERVRDRECWPCKSQRSLVAAHCRKCAWQATVLYPIKLLIHTEASSSWLIQGMMLVWAKHMARSASITTKPQVVAHGVSSVKTEQGHTCVSHIQHEASR
jgi:hypothetical protein